MGPGRLACDLWAPEWLGVMRSVRPSAIVMPSRMHAYARVTRSEGGRGSDKASDMLTVMRRELLGRQR